MGSTRAAALIATWLTACAGAATRAPDAARPTAAAPTDASDASARVSDVTNAPVDARLAPSGDAAAAPPLAESAAGIEAGPLVLSIVDSPTAQTFHVVDHLSRWSASCHAGYARWAAENLPLDEADRAVLARHAALRRARGWGSGFEQAFYVALPIDDAADRAATQRLLTRRESDAERDVLDHFALRLAPVLAAGHDDVVRFEARLRELAPRLAPVARKLTRLTDVRGPQAVTILPMVDPSPKDAPRAALAGARLVVEIAHGSEPMDGALRELFRFVLGQRRESIAIAAGKCKRPIDAETLEEALAYALSPGLMNDAEPSAGGDPLAKLVAEQRASQRTLRVPAVRFARLGLALRPLVAAALDGSAPLGALLADACEAWRTLPAR